jgi:hypothetical protein
VHPDEDLVRFGLRALDLGDAEHLGRPVSLVNDGLHEGAGMFDTER